MSPETRVGLMTIVAFLLVVGVVWYLRGGTLRSPQGYELHVVMKDAAGLEKGTPVRLSGVTVGEVRRVGLAQDGRGRVLARVTVFIRSDVAIPSGSRFQPATSGLVGDRYFAITPPATAGAPIARGTEVPGEEPLSLERLGRRLEDLGDRITTLVDNTNELITDPQMREDLRATLRNAREATALARETVAQARIVADTVRRAGDNIEATTQRIQVIVDRDVAAIAGDLRAMAENLEASSERVRTFMDETSAGGKLSEDIRVMAASLRESGERIRRMAEDLQGAVNKENVAKVNQLVDEVRAGVQEARAVVGQAGSFLGRVDGANPGRWYTGHYGVWYMGGRGGHSLDLTLMPQARRSYHLGLHDVGAGNRFVLQVGGPFTDRLRWRAGVYESQAGVGLDYRVSDPFTLSLDAYNVNLFTVDATARYRLSRIWGVTLGGKDLLRNPSWLVGVGTTF
ncbi:MAG TPA: MlaD family protein [Gemmatimonadales bacterium]|nr:MlaD family protein [Gemmatimonadales bacterium]